MTSAFEPFSDDFKQDPYTGYRELRDHAPVHFAPRSRVWCIARYDDVTHVLNHPEEFSSKRAWQNTQTKRRVSLKALPTIARFLWGMGVPPWAMWQQRMLILEDGARHRDMRNLVNRGFTPRQIQRWEKRIHELVDGCMQAIERKQHFDLVEDLAVPVPVTVISEMLGVEPERRHDFKRWSDAIVSLAGTANEGVGLGAETAKTMVEMKRYLGPIVKRRRAEPRDDLVSLLIEAQEGETALSDHEIFMFFLLLLIAGNETTTNLIGNAVDALLAHPEELQRVAADPALIPGLIEETLRWDSPVQFVQRVAARDTEVGGQTICEGDAVAVILGSANRDERHWDEPERFDPGRDTRGHVGFGFGAHFCLGASLARLEAKAALEALVPRLPELVRVERKIEYLSSPVIRGRSCLALRRAA